MNILHEIRKRKANWIGHIWHINCLLQRVIEGKIQGGWKWQEDKEEDVGSYWMTLRKGEDTLIWKRKLWIALCGEVALEEVLDLSYDRVLNEWISLIVAKAYLYWQNSSIFRENVGIHVSVASEHWKRRLALLSVHAQIVKCAFRQMTTIVN
jgi:hypothetical protein